MRFLILLAVLASLLPAQQNTRSSRHVIVISLDGFAAQALRDPQIAVPHLRQLMREGAYAESMRPVNPTVTWPNHTAMVTGVEPAGHSVLYNGLAVRDAQMGTLRVDATRDKSELVQARTVYDAAHEAGLTTAEVDWVAIQNARTINWSFAEVPKPDGVIEKEMVERGLVTADVVQQFSKQPITLRDDVWTKAAIHIFKEHQPNLLLFHLLTTDSVQHRYAPGSLAAAAALSLADAQVGRILQAVRESPLASRTTILVVSDHGFRAYTKQISPNAILRELGLVRDQDGKPKAEAWAIPEGGSALVYLNRPELREQVVQAFKKTSGVSSVLTPDGFAAYGFPMPDRNRQMSDLVLFAAEGYAFDGANQGPGVHDVTAGTTPGGHGFPNEDPQMQAIFIAWGDGIKPGSRLGPIRNLDVAPTIAQLLGIPFSGGKGVALGTILQSR